MKKRNISFGILALLLVFTTTLHAQISTKEIDKLVNTALQKFNVAGTGIAVVKRGKVVHMKGISPNIGFSFDFQDLGLKRVKDEPSFIKQKTDTVLVSVFKNHY